MTEDAAIVHLDIAVQVSTSAGRVVTIVSDTITSLLEVHVDRDPDDTWVVEGKFTRTAIS